MVNPAKTQVDDEPVSTDCEQAYGEVMAGDEVTRKPMTAAPPSVAGALQEMVAWPLPRTPATERGAPGTSAGTTVPDAPEAAPVPIRLEAATVKV